MQTLALARENLQTTNQSKYSERVITAPISDKLLDNCRYNFCSYGLATFLLI